jgi:hypothetical protein
MPYATFIANNDPEKKYHCGICSDIIENEIVSLFCNPTKHIYCYDCISDWFKQVKNKKYVSSTNYDIPNMCPICRNYGGLLPLNNSDTYVKGVHYIPKIKKILPPKIKYDVCGAKLKTKDGFCQVIGKFNGRCGKHKIIENIVNDKNIQIDEDKKIDNIEYDKDIQVNQQIEVI